MKPVSEAKLADVFTRGQIERTARAGVGRELRYRDNPHRLIVIHLADTDSVSYCIDVMSRILDLDEEWVLVTRYGSVADLGLRDGVEDAKGLSFPSAERNQLATYLCSRSIDLASVSADLYVLSSTGQVMVTWDHHSADEGIQVGLQSVEDAGRLLTMLNQLGVELELFYCA